MRGRFLGTGFIVRVVPRRAPLLEVVSPRLGLRALQVSKVTGLELTGVSASCSLYGPGDHLLVHDDLLADRRVAFILYLAPWRPRAASYRPAAQDALENGASHEGGEPAAGWAEHMGGALELLARDARGRPAGVAHRVFPRNNALAFFAVGADSFHQVGEVLSLELPRLSINGWFHGPAPPAAPPPPPPSPPPEALAPHSRAVLLAQWVSAAYMSPRVRASVQAQMERSSELCLRAFLPSERRAAVLAALAAPGLPWERAGAADRRRYWRLPRAWAERQPDEHALKALLRLLSSAAFCRLLADCTDLALASYQRLEVQRWQPGDFTVRGAAAPARAPRPALTVPCAAAAAARAVPAAAPGGRAVPGRAAAPHLRRRHHLRGARGRLRGRRRPRRGRARHAAARRQRPEPGVLRRRRRLLHQVREQDHAAARRALLHRHLHLPGVTRLGA